MFKLTPLYFKFLTLSQIKNQIRSKTSALYITGNKASETFSVLTPHIDFDERLQNRAEIEQNLKLRGMDTNLDDLVRIWNFYKHIQSKKDDLEDSRHSIVKTIQHLAKQGDRYAAKIETLKAHGKMVKEDMKVLKEEFWAVEEKAAVQILDLPNLIHEKTPETDAKLIHSYLDRPTYTRNHLDLAKELDLVEYNNPTNYYLKNNAALFELALIFSSSDFFTSKQFTQFSNSDFARSVIVEGCALDYADLNQIYTINETELLRPENSKLHLIGGASLASFMAYFARFTIFPTILPLKLFTTGRKYQPVINTEINSLSNTSQETAVNLFIATKDETDMNVQFDLILSDLIEFYESLGYHFKVKLLPVRQLEKWESLRASFQMVSSGNDIEVGHLSLTGNYISKRLLFNYGKGYDVRYPCIITGTILSVPKILASVLELNEKEFRLPDELCKKYI